MVLSDGTIVHVSAEIDTLLWNVTEVHYTLHVPSGLSPGPGRSHARMADFTRDLYVLFGWRSGGIQQHDDRPDPQSKHGGDSAHVGQSPAQEHPRH